MVTASIKPAPSNRLQQADELKEARKLEEAITFYKHILADASKTEETLKEQEYALSQLGQLYRDLQ
jgi:26S proteasome regulatory subunit N6